jgi:hypothetical protein
VAENRWESYNDSRSAGIIAHPAFMLPSSFSATVGRGIYADRPGSVDLLVPTAATASQSERIRRHPDLQRKFSPEERISLVNNTLEDSSRDRPPRTNRAIAMISAALADRKVRGRILVQTVAQNRLSDAHRLWMLLANNTPEPHRTWPATLLGATAYLSGDAPLASAALHIALRAHSLHTLAGILLETVARGIPGSNLRSLVIECLVGMPNVDR